MATLASDRTENKTKTSKPVNLLARPSLLINISEKFLHKIVALGRPRRLVPPSQQRMSTVWALRALEVEKIRKNPDPTRVPMDFNHIRSLSRIDRSTWIDA